MSLDEFSKDQPSYENLSAIRTASISGADIVCQLLNYSHKAEQTLAPVNIIPVIHDTLSFLRSSLPSTVIIDSGIFPKTAVVMSTPSRSLNITCDI